MAKATAQAGMISETSTPSLIPRQPFEASILR
jgi:hypothetical protein